MRFLRLPPWAPDVALGAIGGALGSCGTLLVMDFAGRHWTAFGAIATALGAFATFCAVLAALYPILRSEERRQAAAMALCSSLYAKLGRLYVYLKTCEAEGAGAPLPKGSAWFEFQPAKDALDALLTLMPATEALDRNERIALSRALALCEEVRGKPADTIGAIGFLPFVSEAYELIGARLGLANATSRLGVFVARTLTELEAPAKPPPRESR